MKKSNIAFSIIFLLIIYFFFISDVISEDTLFSIGENRNLEQKPTLTIEALVNGTYMEKYEKYVTNQIFFRDEFISMSTNTKLLMGQKEINNVYVLDDCLIEKFTEADIDKEALTTKNKLIKTFLSNHQNAHFSLIPTAADIYSDKISKYADNANQKELIENIYKNIESENTIDIYSDLAAHSAEDIYFKTDHHWTALGSYYGYLAICEELGLTPVPLDNFTTEVIDDSFSGTIQSKINIDFDLDTLYKYIPSNKMTHKLILNEDYKNVSDDLYDESKLETKEKYAVYLGGNNAVTRIKTTGGIENKGKLLIIKDSFSHCLTPFLTNHYSEIVLLDLRYYMMGAEMFMRSERGGFDDILILYNIDNYLEDTFIEKLNK